jgi:hypothetical protein
MAGIGVTLWQGVYEGLTQTWLRWCGQDGTVIPTGAERAEQERQRAERLAAQQLPPGLVPLPSTWHRTVQRMARWSHRKTIWMFCILSVSSPTSHEPASWSSGNACGIRASNF